MNVDTSNQDTIIVDFGDGNWSEDTIKWFVDDIEMFRVTPSSFNTIPSLNSWPFNNGSWYIMINLAITQGGPNANTIFPNNIEIDYVRVYQNNTIAGIIIEKTYFGLHSFS